MFKNDKIEAECREMFNEICLVHDFQLARLVGVHFDAMDAYYIVRTMRGAISHGKELPEGGREYLASAAGHCTTMKGHPRYEALESTFARNGSPAVEEFIVTVDERPIEELWPDDEQD